MVFTLLTLESFLPITAACRESNVYKKDVTNVCKRKYTLLFMRASNFGGEVERSYIFLQSEAENVLKIFVNLLGIYHLMTLKMWKLFWKRYE